MKMRSILVGERESCALAARQLKQLDHPPMIVGLVVLDDVQSGSEEGIEILGSINRLTDLCAKHEIAQAIVTLPASHRSEGRGISAALHRAGVVERFIPPMDELLDEVRRIKALQAQAVPAEAANG